MAISVQDESAPADWHLHVRGEIRNLGPKVPRGFLTAASGRGSMPPAIRDGESGRRELADWIASDEHPLTARVIVNRAWHWLFGVGLVRTVDNFGHMGEAPSHPELLDALTVEFVQGGWSIKRLVRRIVLCPDVRSRQRSSARGRCGRSREPPPFLRLPPASGGRRDARYDSLRLR